MKNSHFVKRRMFHLQASAFPRQVVSETVKQDLNLSSESPVVAKPVGRGPRNLVIEQVSKQSTHPLKPSVAETSGHETSSGTLETSIVKKSSVLKRQHNPWIRPEPKTAQAETYKVLLYICCYNEGTEALAKSRFDKYAWAKVHRFREEDQKDGLFENVMYFKDLMSLQHEWSSLDYVGCLSYKAVTKLNISKLDSSLKLWTTEMPDAVFFYCANGSVHQANKYHKKFTTIWNDVIVQQCGIRGIKNAFYNFWMCKPELMKDYCTFFCEKIWPSLVEHPNAFDNSHYRGLLKPERLVQINRVPHYSHVPFILERVPRNYFEERGLKVVCM